MSPNSWFLVLVGRVCSAGAARLKGTAWSLRDFAGRVEAELGNPLVDFCLIYLEQHSDALLIILSGLKQEPFLCDCWLRGRCGSPLGPLLRCSETYPVRRGSWRFGKQLSWNEIRCFKNTVGLLFVSKHGQGWSGRSPVTSAGRTSHFGDRRQAFGSREGD